MFLKKEDRAILFNLTVVVVALGYFVDIFDLTLFNMVRRQSLLDIGIPESELVDKGLFLLNTQMIGMLLGGIFWGQMGDRRGRMSSLFASIVLYSVANLLNAFVQNFEQYVVLRFIAGIGLAGELGVGITLVAELLPKDKRGLGTAFVATIGVLGAVLGGIFVEVFTWRTCYIIGGVMGLLLLLMRVSVKESELFHKVKSHGHVRKGNFFDLFKTWNSTKKFITCTLIGVPIWYVAGILMPFAPELGKNLGVTDPLLSSRAIAITYLGLALGDFLSGVLSQALHSRKKALAYFQLGCLFLILILMFTVGGNGHLYFYFLAFWIGVGAGFWALFVTIAAENFGTNLRSTAATSIPNFVRAGVFPMSLLLAPLKQHLEYWQATLVVGLVVFAIALIGTYYLRETFSEDLEYLEHH
ncbi:MAG: MFS transporter [Bdellovibrionales bacterium]